MLPCIITEGDNRIGNIAFGKPKQSCPPPQKKTSQVEEVSMNEKCHRTKSFLSVTLPYKDVIPT